MSEDSWEEDDWSAEEDAECYYGAEFCIDPFCRDVESCVSCELMIGEEEKEKKVEPKRERETEYVVLADGEAGELVPIAVKDAVVVREK